jgi:hypothetical protein
MNGIKEIIVKRRGTHEHYRLLEINGKGKVR